MASYGIISLCKKLTHNCLSRLRSINEYLVIDWGDLQRPLNSKKLVSHRVRLGFLQVTGSRKLLSTADSSSVVNRNPAIYLGPNRVIDTPYPFVYNCDLLCLYTSVVEGFLMFKLCGYNEFLCI